MTQFPARFSSALHRNIWMRERNNAQLAGRGGFPICHHCDKPVDPLTEGAGHLAHHVTTPAWAVRLGAKRTSHAIAHAACNLKHGRTVETPAAAQHKRLSAVEAEHQRRMAGEPWRQLSRYPMQGGRLSRNTRAVGGRVRRRLSAVEKQAAFIRKRGILTQQSEA